MKTEKILSMIVKDFIKYQEGKRARQVMVGRCQYAGTELIGYTPEGHNAYFLLPSYFPFDVEKLTAYKMNFNAFTENVPLEKLENTHSKIDTVSCRKKATLRIYKTADGKNVYVNDKVFVGFENDILLTGTSETAPVYVWEGGSIGNSFPAGLIMPTRYNEGAEE